jgi:hypothetical protein
MGSAVVKHDCRHASHFYVVKLKFGSVIHNFQ